MADIVGKLSDMRFMSCSRLPSIMGFSKYNTPNDELVLSVEAMKNNKASQVSAVSEPAFWGTIHENSIQETGAEKIDCDIKMSVREKVEAEAIPLQGSLDGILTSRLLKGLSKPVYSHGHRQHHRSQQ